jgi:hypothetical protein
VYNSANNLYSYWCVAAEIVHIATHKWQHSLLLKDGTAGRVSHKVFFAYADNCLRYSCFWLLLKWLVCSICKKEDFRNLGMPVTNQNDIHEEDKSRLNLGNISYYFIQDNFVFIFPVCQSNCHSVWGMDLEHSYAGLQTESCLEHVYLSLVFLCCVVLCR